MIWIIHAVDHGQGSTPILEVFFLIIVVVIQVAIRSSLEVLALGPSRVQH